ncbi:hypothetical protein ABZX30_29860 [Streptomyces sp. NPDC004542]|uniref:hypothetical protein n=1 Tax=Streptomyces sp. NPDC004542 TaxID=3154281 RepID=UPI0033ACD7E5
MPKSAHYVATRRVLHKPELKPRIVDFIADREAVHSADIGREFFNGDGHQTRRYLTALDREGRITSTRRGKYLWWSLAGVEVTAAALADRTPKPIGNPGPRLTEEERQARRERRARKAREKRREERAKRPTPTRPPKVRAHSHCPHEDTKAERAKCRKATAKADEIAELADTERWLNQVEACEAIDPSLEVGEYDPMEGIRERQAARRKKSRERLEAEGKHYGWRKKYRMGMGPTVYALAHYIHVRMKNDRRHKGYYRFTYEWVRSHYPHLLANYRDLVEDALELLVIQGKIERLDIPVKVTVSGSEEPA